MGPWGGGGGGGGGGWMRGDGDEGQMVEHLARLGELLNRWRCTREGGGLVRVRCKEVIPDWTNRERTGVSMEHCHWLSHRFRDEGFDDVGHEIPVVVRESTDSALGAAALERWCRILDANPGVMPPSELCDACGDGGTDGGLDRPSSFSLPPRRIFTSLGSSHFNQALNLHRAEWLSIFDGTPYESIQHDAKLRDAIEGGVPSVVLRGDTPEADRKFISEVLNRTHDYAFRVDPSTGVVSVSPLTRGESSESHPGRKLSMFEALSKSLDSEELSSLVRIKLGVDVDEAKEGYRSKVGGKVGREDREGQTDTMGETPRSKL